MIDENVRRYILDEEHLKLLSYGYMVSAGFHALYSLFGFMYVFMGIAFTSIVAHAPQTNPADQMPAFFGWFFVAIGIAFIVALLGFAALQFVAAQKLKQRKGRVFVMVVAAFTCLGIPFGTFLGVMTFIVLGRPSVMHLFGEQPAPPVNFISAQ
jgi:hypothetical protein